MNLHSRFVRAYPTRLLISLFLLLILTACQSTHKSSQSFEDVSLPLQDTRALLYFDNQTTAPYPNLQIFINDLYIGEVHEFTVERLPFKLVQGHYKVMIKAADTILYQQYLHIQDQQVYTIEVKQS